MDGLHQPLGDRLEHQTLGGGHLAQAPEVLDRQHPEVGVGQDPALQRLLTGPHHVGGEVRKAELDQARRDAGVHLGLLAGEHEQLLDPMLARRAIEDRGDLVGRVQVRLVGRERAVLAVAAACTRERQREIAAEGDPAAHAPEV